MPSRLSPSDVLVTQDYTPTSSNGSSPSFKKRKRDSNNESFGPASRVTSLGTSSSQTRPSHDHLSGSSEVSLSIKSTVPGSAPARPRKRLRVVKNESQTQSTASSPSSKTPSEALTKSTNPPPPTSSLLASCHICHRRPFTKTQLSSYGDCEACQLRTCFICMRVCEGPCQQEGREKKICSTCCVEQGVDGTVLCLDCLGRCGDDDGHPPGFNADVRKSPLHTNGARSYRNGPGNEL